MICTQKFIYMQICITYANIYLSTHIYIKLSYVYHLYFHVFQSKYSVIFITFENFSAVLGIIYLWRCVIPVEQFGHIRCAYLRL